MKFVFYIRNPSAENGGTDLSKKQSLTKIGFAFFS